MYLQQNRSLGQATSVQVAPLIDTGKAIRSNRIYSQQLGWLKYYKKIVRFLGLTGRPSDSEFAGAVARWQVDRGLKPDGMLGPLAWNLLRPSIAESGSGEAVQLPEEKITAAAARLDRFLHNSADLTEDHRRNIARTAARIAESWRLGLLPIMTVKVVGHTDATGKPAYNQMLGLRRALAVRKELQRALEKKTRHLSYKVLVLASSKGARERVDESNTPDGDALNRRVEVFLSTKALMPPKVQPPPDLPIDIKIPVFIPEIKPPKLPVEDEGCREAEFKNLRNECLKQYGIDASVCGGVGYLRSLLVGKKALRCARFLPNLPATLLCAIPLAGPEYVGNMLKVKECIDRRAAEGGQCLRAARQFTNCPKK
jgi:outer membrane protein OmpA-like peptidoglycan-associated protein